MTTMHVSEERFRGLTPGRIVHYVLAVRPARSGGARRVHRPAMVVEVSWEAELGKPTRVNLQVFTGQSDGYPNTPLLHVANVPYADPADGELAGTWHWIEGSPSATSYPSERGDAP